MNETTVIKSIKNVVETTFDKLDELNKASQINAVSRAMDGAISVVKDSESIEQARFTLPYFKDAIIQQMKEAFNEIKENK